MVIRISVRCRVPSVHSILLATRTQDADAALAAWAWRPVAPAWRPPSCRS
ncbi:hypothetical protein [Actinophytocola sp.]|nr:hypothetical protein [Actinophytocola sp.]HYQ69406.1 hypothetical protein [Actinophytocola sp.]